MGIKFLDQLTSETQTPRTKLIIQIARKLHNEHTNIGERTVQYEITTMYARGLIQPKDGVYLEPKSHGMFVNDILQTVGYIKSGLME